MGVDKHHLALVLVLGIILIGLLVLLFVGRTNFAGQATFTEIEPKGCRINEDCLMLTQDDPENNVDFVCETISEICVPANRNADTDGDGLKDYDEVVFYGTNYRAMDSDGDGLIDSREAVVWEAGQAVDGSSNLVVTLTSSLKRLFEVD